MVRPPGVTALAWAAALLAAFLGLVALAFTLTPPPRLGLSSYVFGAASAVSAFLLARVALALRRLDPAGRTGALVAASLLAPIGALSPPGGWLLAAGSVAAIAYLWRGKARSAFVPAGNAPAAPPPAAPVAPPPVRAAAPVVPAPVRAAAAAPRAPTPAPFLDAVRALRPLGFFEPMRALPDAQLAARLAQALGTAPPRSATWETRLAALDPTRVVTVRLANAERGAYAKLLARLARVSRGHFVPEDVRETWASDAGPARVTLHHDGERVALRAEGGRLDLGLVEDLNGVLAGARYEIVREGDAAFVVLLTSKERAVLEARGWRFEREAPPAEFVLYDRPAEGRATSPKPAAMRA